MENKLAVASGKRSHELTMHCRCPMWLSIVSTWIYWINHLRAKVFLGKMYYGCWCPENTSSQGISNHDIGCLCWTGIISPQPNGVVWGERNTTSLNSFMYTLVFQVTPCPANLGYWQSTLNQLWQRKSCRHSAISHQLLRCWRMFRKICPFQVDAHYIQNVC